MYTGHTLYFWGIPVEEIAKDVKDGKFILKSKGNINGNIKAQTVIVYGNVNGPIQAEQVVIINGNTTGNIKADTVTKLESKKQETCKSCKYYTEENCIPSLFYCKEKKSAFVKSDIKICEKYQKKENKEKKTCSSCVFYSEDNRIPGLYKCGLKTIFHEDICSSYQKKENPAKQVSSPVLPTKKWKRKSSIKDIKRVPVISSYH